MGFGAFLGVSLLGTSQLSAYVVCGKSEGPHASEPQRRRWTMATLTGSKGKARGQRREQLARHVTSFLAICGPVMLLLGLGVVCRAGVVLEMLR